MYVYSENEKKRFSFTRVLGRVSVPDPGVLVGSVCGFLNKVESGSGYQNMVENRRKNSKFLLDEK